MKPQLSHTPNVSPYELFLEVRFSPYYFQLTITNFIQENSFFDNPTVTQILKKFLAFYGARRFTVVFTRACHLFQSWARWIHSVPCHPISLRSILILTSSIRLPSGLFPSAFPIETLYAYLFSHIRATRTVHFMFLHSIALIIIQGVQIMQSIIMQFPLAFCYALPLRSKYSFKYPGSQTSSIYVLTFVSGIKNHTHSTQQAILQCCVSSLLRFNIKEEKNERFIRLYNVLNDIIPQILFSEMPQHFTVASATRL
jgi:hypothetical protein